jgi:uncharacterized repeat protein (TIGR03803 family)
MRIVHWGVVTTVASLIFAGWTLPAPVETVIHSFSAPPSSGGSSPQAGLIANKEGALYGTTSGGGAVVSGTQSEGIVFKLTPPAKGQTTWTETVLHSFVGGTDGASPYAGLIADERGALYGTTSGGGTANWGTVFKLTPPAKGQTTWTETGLYSFLSGSDGAFPQAGLIADKQGALYGTTLYGGSGGNGTVFKLTPPARGQTATADTPPRV